MSLRIALTALLLIISMPSFAADEEQISAEEAQYLEWSQGIWDSLNRQTGIIRLDDANATLNIPEDFYYLSADDAEKVLVEVWGNPPGQKGHGMLFPAKMTPFDRDSWGVTIEYEEDGYVSDEDADEIDYDALLEQMQDDMAEASKERIRLGYEAVELVGWASTPYYDHSSKKLHWAKEIKFGSGERTNTLNYNIRVLGRKGVLVLNFIAGMDQKEMIQSKIETVLALADFDDGSQYSDFLPDVDTVAAYGIGALVAGKVLAKTGFLVMGLIFLKKFGIFVILGIGAMLKKFFRKTNT